MRKLTKILLLLLSIPYTALCQLDNNFPYRYKKSDQLLLTAGAGIGLTAALISENRSINVNEIERLNASDINFFDRSATRHWNSQLDTYSDYAAIAATLAPLIVNYPEFFFKRNFNKNLVLSLMYTESLIFSYNLAALSKNLTYRIRPFMYNQQLTAEERYDISLNENYTGAFYSRHTALAFCSAAFLSKVYTDIHGPSTTSKIIWASSMVAATSVGVLRYYSGQHYPTDIITGAIIGGLTGFFIPVLHKKENTAITLNLGPGIFYIAYTL